MDIIKPIVVQFDEQHKWAGCLGIVKEVKSWGYLVGVPIPEQGIAYIRVEREDVIPVGMAALVEED